MRNKVARKDRTSQTMHGWTIIKLISKMQELLTKETRVRKTLESCHTAMTTEADNSARSLPRQYSILLK